MDLTTLRAVLAELEPQLVPSRFEKAQQPAGQRLQLGLRSLVGLQWIELSWLAEAPRLHRIAPPTRQGEGSTLAQQLQHGLRGLALVTINQQGFERVVELGFARRPGEPLERTLVLELMGRHSNLFLLDQERVVIALARQVREQHSRQRPIGTGDPYQSPPPLQGEPPSSGEPFARWQQRLTLQDLSLKQALLSGYQGVSPALVDQLIETELAALPVSRLNSDQWQRLHGRWLLWLQALDRQLFTYTPTPAGGYCCWWQPAQAGAAASLNGSLAAYYAAALDQRAFAGLQRQWLGRLEQLQCREREQLQHQQDLLQAGEQADALQAQADQLLCQAHRDPEAVEQAQALYRRARRLRRSGAVIRERIGLHQQRLAWFEASLIYLEQAEDLPALESLLADLSAVLDAADQGRPTRSRSRRAAVQQDQPQPLELHAPGGLRLQVGRNHRQNVWISLRQARRGDLWFHAQECPGSHVVLKASEGVPTDADLAAAAHLAAYFSRGRGNARVPVVMVPTEDLQRISGAPAGTVRHSGGTVVWGIPAQAAALLASAPTLQAEERP